MRAIFLHACVLYRQNFGALLMLTMVIWIPCEFFSSWMEHFVFDENNFRRSIQLQRFLDNFFGIIVTSGAYYIFREKDAHRPVTMTDAWGAAFSYWGRMFATRFIVGVGVVLGLILLIVPGLILLVRLAVIENIVVAEDTWGFACARRSFDLTKGYFWRICYWTTVGAIPCALAAIMCYVLAAFIPGADNWIGDAITSVLADIPLMFLYPLMRAIYTRLLEDERAQTPGLPVA